MRMHFSSATLLEMLEFHILLLYRILLSRTVRTTEFRSNMFIILIVNVNNTVDEEINNLLTSEFHTTLKGMIWKNNFKAPRIDVKV